MDARKAAAKTIKPPLCVPKGHLFINSFNNNINNMFIMGCYVHVGIQLAMLLKTKIFKLQYSTYSNKFREIRLYKVYSISSLAFILDKNLKQWKCVEGRTA